MVRLNSFCWFIILISISAIVVTAKPAITYENNAASIYTVMDNFWWNGLAPISIRTQNPSSGYTAYETGIGQGQVKNGYLAFDADNLDLGSKSNVWFKDKNGVWQNKDSSKRIAWLNSSIASGKLKPSKYNSGSDESLGGKTNYYSSSAFELQPYWLASGSMSGSTIYNNWVNQNNSSNNNSNGIAAGGNQTIPSNTITNVPVAPAPGSILLGAIGVAIVGYLRSRKTIMLS